MGWPDTFSMARISLRGIQDGGRMIFARLMWILTVYCVVLVAFGFCRDWLRDRRK